MLRQVNCKYQILDEDRDKNKRTPLFVCVKLYKKAKYERCIVFLYSTPSIFWACISCPFSGGEKRRVTKSPKGHEAQVNLKLIIPSGGASKISKELMSVSIVSEAKAKKYLELYFYDTESNTLFRKSVNLEMPHRPCVLKEELVDMIRKNHSLDHRKGETIYEALRSIYSVVRETELLLKEELVDMIRKNHSLDHRKGETIYEALRRNIYPVV